MFAFKLIYPFLFLLFLADDVIISYASSDEKPIAVEALKVQDNKEMDESAQDVTAEANEEFQVPRSEADSAPDGIPEEISRSLVENKSVFEYDPFDIVAKPWRKLNSKLRQLIRLDLSLAYTALYQVASSATQGELKNQAAGGIWDFNGLLQIFSAKSKYQAYIGFRSTSKHRLFTDIPPSQLAQNIGSLWRTDGVFSVNNFYISQIWWEQHLFEDKFIFRIGKLDQADYIDSFNFSSSKLYFINTAFSSNPSIPFPGTGLGAAAIYQPSELFYILASIGDANADSATFEFDTFFNEQEFFMAVEVGIAPSINLLGKGNYHISLWNSDGKQKEGVPSGNGLAITLQQNFRNKYNSFLRYSFSNGRVTNVKQLLSAGVGVYDPLRLGMKDNLLGLALAWGDPENKSLRSQYVIESFLRMQIFRSTQLTPDLQLIINPSNAPEKNIVAVFGMRLRVAF